MSLFSSLSSLAKQAWPFAKKHLPEVAIISGTILDGIAIIFAIDETTTAQKILEGKKPETFMEKVGIVVPAYWKTILTFAAGTGLILFGNKVHLDRLAVVTGIAATQKDKLAALAEEAKKVVGPKKAKEIEDRAIAAKTDLKALPSGSAMPVIMSGDTMYVLQSCGYAFRSCPETLNTIEKNMLRIISEDEQLSEYDLLRDYFDVPEMLIKRESINQGWTSKNPPEFKVTWTDAPNGSPVGIITFKPDPDPKWTLNDI